MIQDKLFDLNENCNLLLVVGKPGSGKSRILNEYSYLSGIPVLDLNTIILDNDGTKLQKIIEGFLQNYKYDVILIDKKDILYKINSKPDPLDFLLKLSKKKSVIASFNGYIKDDKIYHIVNNKQIEYPITEDFKYIQI